MRALPVLCLLLLTLPSPARAGPRCLEGQRVADGHCCWPGQSFDSGLGECVGAPRCPPGLTAVGPSCARLTQQAPAAAPAPAAPVPNAAVPAPAPAPAPALAACPAGLVAPDGVHCCWPGQVFSPQRGACAGTPVCPPGLVAYGEGCAALTAPSGLVPADALAPPPVPFPAPVPLQSFAARFESKEDEHAFEVSVDGGPSCRTPCSLAVTAGVHRVLIKEGEHRFTEKVRFPASPSTVKVDRRHGDRIALAATSMAVGVPVAVAGAYCVLYGAVFSTLGSDDSLGRAGQGLIVGGGIALVGGAILAAVGGSWGLRHMGRNVARVAPQAPWAEAAPVQLEGLALAPTRGGAVLGASLRF